MLWPKPECYQGQRIDFAVVGQFVYGLKLLERIGRLRSPEAIHVLLLHESFVGERLLNLLVALAGGMCLIARPPDAMAPVMMPAMRVMSFRGGVCEAERRGEHSHERGNKQPTHQTANVAPNSKRVWHT